MRTHLAAHHRTAWRPEEFSVNGQTVAHRALRFFKPGPAAVVAVILGAAIALVIFGAFKVHARLAVEAEIRAACAAEVQAIQNRHAFTRHYLLPVEPCRALEVVRAGR